MLRLKHAAQSQKQVINCQVFILVEIVTDSCDGGFVVYSSNHDGNRLFDDSLAWIRRKFWHLVAVELGEGGATWFKLYLQRPDSIRCRYLLS